MATVGHFKLGPDVWVAYESTGIGDSVRCTVYTSAGQGVSRLFPSLAAGRRELAAAYAGATTTPAARSLGSWVGWSVVGGVVLACLYAASRASLLVVALACVFLFYVC